MSALLTVGRTFSVSNPDMMVYTEDLAVVDLTPPRLRLRSARWNAVDIAGVHYTSEDEVVGEILQATDAQVVVKIHSHPPEVGLLLTAQEARWLLSPAEVADALQRGSA